MLAELHTCACILAKSCIPVHVPAGYDRSTRGFAISMTVAHWCYWTSGLSKGPSVLMKLLGYGPKKTSDAMRDLVANHEGMSFDKFLAYAGKKKLPISNAQAKALFDMADADGNGSIDEEEVEKLICQLLIMFPDLDKKEVEVEEVFEAAGRQKLQRQQSGSPAPRTPKMLDHVCTTPSAMQLYHTCCDGRCYCIRYLPEGHMYIWPCLY